MTEHLTCWPPPRREVLAELFPRGGAAETFLNGGLVPAALQLILCGRSQGPDIMAAPHKGHLCAKLGMPPYSRTPRIPGNRPNIDLVMQHEGPHKFPQYPANRPRRCCNFTCMSHDSECLLASELESYRV